MKLFASLAALMFGASLAIAEEDLNWNTSQHNFQLQSNDWSLEIRTVLDDDYDHMEVSKVLSNGLIASLRYAEDGTSTEIRPKLTQKLFANDTWFFNFQPAGSEVTSSHSMPFVVQAFA